MKSSTTLAIGLIAVSISLGCLISILHMLTAASEYLWALIALAPLAFICALLPMLLISRLRPDWFKPGWLRTYPFFGPRA